MIGYQRPAHLLAFALAALAGFVDALGFLQLGGLFVSFMSGNSTRLAVGLAAPPGAAPLAALLIGAFVGGVIVGSLVSAAVPEKHRKAAVLAVVTATLIAAAAASHYAPGGTIVVAAMAAAMGCANTVFQREGEVSIGVTYMTGTLVKLGQRIAQALRGGNRFGWTPYLLLWAALLAGALAGATSYAWIGLGSLWIAAAWSAALSLLAWQIDFRAKR